MLSSIVLFYIHAMSGTRTLGYHYTSGQYLNNESQVTMIIGECQAHHPDADNRQPPYVSILILAGAYAVTFRSLLGDDKGRLRRGISQGMWLFPTTNLSHIHIPPQLNQANTTPSQLSTTSAPANEMIPHPNPNPSPKSTRHSPSIACTIRRHSPLQAPVCTPTLLVPSQQNNMIVFANETTVIAPLGGYQYVPVETVEPGNDRSLASWTNCPNFDKHIRAFNHNLRRPISHVAFDWSLGPPYTIIGPSLFCFVMEGMLHVVLS
ncbi:uncharacterized protein LACBIDRAFT_331519 [Laccaria bicolor S238N-H82]|uniref:Predicted protein n=1 Tax=Laccaria bicolor (strain S238N-H82 / ATCC MYA-4686) TaxID=486041 RepID=B0DPQ5_LACBS|nr:uncharacterized protein LACBIDRAFT_331519 [Laccaria bicolor S238N-H82]EDR03419.1 predicted protein [Laccaria bicolor S238N-H82]|eukprot:XP_001885875.1 predicted protein [Laccaria bicolor S238N-H82]